MTDNMEDVGLLLKLANEAGGVVDVGRLLQRRPTSAARAAFERARLHNFVADDGRITAAGYRWLGQWINEGDT